MKQTLLFFAFALALCLEAQAQVNNIVLNAGVAYTNGAPTFRPGGKGSRIAIDTVTWIWYESLDNNTGNWIESGYRVQPISGCSHPAYTPNKHQSVLVINGCDSLYYYRAGAWRHINPPGVSGVAWGDITGDITNQIDLQTALSDKADAAHNHALSDVLQSGATSGQVPKWNGSAWVPATDDNTGTTYTAGAGIAISGGNVISNTGDLSSTNEIQTVSFNSGTGNLSISGGNSASLDGRYLQSEVDGSVTNEIQTLSIAGQNLSLSNGGGTVTLPSVGGSGVLKYDNYRLPATYMKIPATGLNANESVTNYGFASVNNIKYKLSSSAMGSTSTEYGGWLANGTSGDSIAISAPFWVIIGDSQAEGHGANHGRLHPDNVATFSQYYQDNYGTISYTLRQKTKMRWFNHGIGSQTSTQVWARWARDVLGQTYDPGDGRGSKTLQRKPQGVVVIVGVNDIANGTTPIFTVAGNLENMARSARDNGIQCVFLNCPGDETGTLAFYRKIDSLNTYFASGALQGFGASVVDYNSWWRDASYNDNAHGQALIQDDIHPSSVGYDSLANFIFRAAKLPVLDSLTIYTDLSPAGFSGYSRPTSITIQGAPYTLSGDAATIPFATALAWDSVWVKIVASTNVTGTTYSGFSHVVWHLKNDTVGIVTRNNALYNAFGGVSNSLWTVNGNSIYTSELNKRLVIGGTTNSKPSMLAIKSPLNTGNYILNASSSSASDIFNILDNGRVVVNSASLGGYKFAVNGDVLMQNIGGSQYSYINGSLYQIYGGNPELDLQSTSVNTGGSGFTQTALIWNGSDCYFVPHPTRGVNNTFSYRNLAGDNVWRIDLANKAATLTSQSLGTTVSNAAALSVQNTTAATSGQQQISPLIKLSGQGFATGAGFSRAVDFRMYVTPTSGSLPTGMLGIGSGINNSYTDNQVNIFSTGQFAVGTTTPSASAIVDVSSTTGGILFPRMTTTQRDAIATPADGLVIYNTTTSKFQGRAGGAWVDLH